MTDFYFKEAYMLRVARVCILDAASSVIWYCGMIGTLNVMLDL
jgi:hypothetical protein